MPPKKRAVDTDSFVKQARHKHGDDRYDYAKVTYANSQQNVIIFCTRCQADFLQRPEVHLKGHGCPKCGSERKTAARRETTAGFIAKARTVHGSDFNYDKVHYVNSRTKVLIICTRCEHEFWQAANSHLRGNGCPNCAPAKTADGLRHTTADFIAKAREVHGPTRYDYKAVEYVSSTTKVTIGCNECGTTFRLAASSHTQGRGCKRCTKEQAHDHQRLTLDQFIEKAVAKHGPTAYDYSAVAYRNNWTKVSITCTTCSTTFLQRPSCHMSGDGCLACARRRLKVAHSKIACEWLDAEAKRRGIFIRHAGNLGEQQIRGPNGEAYWVDGYCAEKDQVFEFHGSFWHAHPTVATKRNARHPVKRRQTNEEVYQATLQREAAIRKCGYELIVMWEVLHLACILAPP